MFGGKLQLVGSFYWYLALSYRIEYIYSYLQGDRIVLAVINKQTGSTCIGPASFTVDYEVFYESYNEAPERKKNKRVLGLISRISFVYRQPCSHFVYRIVYASATLTGI